MEFLSSNNSANETCTSLFVQQFLNSHQNGTFPLRNNLISTAIDAHFDMLGNNNNPQIDCHNFPKINQSQTGYLNINQLLAPINKSVTDQLDPSHNLNNLLNQFINNQVNLQQIPLINNRIIYHSVEDCIIDENNLFDNINVFNADETKQTKVLVMPTTIYGKYLQPILDQIKGRLFYPTSLTMQVNSSPNEISNVEDMLETEDEDDELIDLIDKSSESSIPFKNSSNNNYSKASNKKGIKKKRKYIKSGLFRKDRNGNFLFSSADRSRLATLIDTPGNPPNQGSEIWEADSNTYQTISPPSNVSEDVAEEDRLGFELYCRETVPLHKDTASNALLLKEQWRALLQVERDRYLKRSVVMGFGELSNNEILTQLDDEFSDMIKDNNGKYSRVKRPLNAYNIFCKIHFPEFQQKHPDLTINQISKLIGEKWKTLSNSEKQPYIEKSKNSMPVVKKPLNAYNIFCKNHFLAFQQQYPDLTINQISKKVAEAWKNLSEDEKNSYKRK